MDLKFLQICLYLPLKTNFYLAYKTYHGFSFLLYHQKCRLLVNKTRHSGSWFFHFRTGSAFVWVKRLVCEQRCRWVVRDCKKSIERLSAWDYTNKYTEIRDVFLIVKKLNFSVQYLALNVFMQFLHDYLCLFKSWKKHLAP